MPSEEETYRKSMYDKIDDLKSFMVAAIGEVQKDVEEIKIQTKKTNGRVTKIEKILWGMYGGWVVVATILFPLIIEYLRTHGFIL